MSFKNFAAAVTMFAALALFVVACSSTPGSPASPGAIMGGSATLENGTGSCTDKEDNDKDGSVDCDDPDCADDPACQKEPPPPPPPPPGNCSPGFWKNHPSEFQAACALVELSGTAPANLDTCAELLEAISCSGGPATGCTGARRQAAATLLNAVSGCTE